MNMRTFKLAAVLALVAAVLVFSMASIAYAGGNGPIRTYQVTITNLTSGQPLTPPLIATHTRQADVFTVGEAASLGIQEIAENGNLGPLFGALSSSDEVYEVLIAPAPLVPAGTPGAAMFSDSVTLEITAAANHRYISFASMLICTNDGFTGLDSVKLPNGFGQTLTVYANGYDAGTELNTEDFADMVPPCQGLIGVASGEAGTGMSNPALAEGGVIHHHPGILGGSDLIAAIHGWADPVVMVTIKRIN